MNLYLILCQLIRKESVKMSEEKWDIELTGDEEFILTYDYLPYSYYRIVEILRTYYNAELNLVRGYKEGRYNPDYKQRYEIRDITTKEVVNENIHLDDLRYFFANKNIPLVEEKKPVKNAGAKLFMDILKARSGGDTYE